MSTLTAQQSTSQPQNPEVQARADAPRQYFIPRSFESYTLEKLRQERAEFARKPRRILFANDGVDTIDPNPNHRIRIPEDDEQLKAQFQRGAQLEPGPEMVRFRFLRQRTLPLANSQVDAHLYNTVTWGFPISQQHRTTLGINVLSPYGKTLYEAGIDPLNTVIEQNRSAHIESWWTFRVNSLHDGWDPEFKRFFQANTFKQQNLSYVIDPEGAKRLTLGWSALNYGLEEVRAYILAYIGELLQNYDVDAIDIDFMRFPFLFKSVYQQNPATQEERDLLTEWMRQVRQLTELQGLIRKRPIAVHVRVSDSLSYNLDHGIDIERWLQDDLVDFVTVGGIVPLVPFAQAIEPLKKYGKPIYVSIENTWTARLRERVSRGSPRAPELRSRTEGYRGRAMEAWHAGADGIYVLNWWFYRNCGNLIREVGSAQSLVGLDKLYFAAWNSNSTSVGLPNSRYAHQHLLAPVNPAELSQKWVEFQIPMADDLTAAESKGLQPTIRLMLQFRELPQASMLEVQFNQHPLLEPGLPMEHETYPFSLDIQQVKRGMNSLKLRLKNPVTQTVLLEDAYLEVRYRSPNS